MPTSLRSLLVVLSANVLLCGCSDSRTKEPTHAQRAELALSESDPEVRARLLMDIVAEQLSIKDTLSAGQVSAKAIKAAQEIKDPGMRAEVLLDIAKQSAVGGSRIQASLAIDTARVAVATISDRRAKIAATISLAEAVYKLEDPQTRVQTATAILNGAEPLIETVTATEEKIPLLASLAAARMLVSGKASGEALLKTAAAEAAAVADVRSRVRTQIAAAAALYQAGRGEDGRPFFDAAAASARSQTDPQARGYALLDIVRGLSSFRTQLPLGELAVESQTAAEAIKDQDQRNVLLREIQAVRTAPQ